MASGKKSFLIYLDSRNLVDKLSDERAGKLFKILLSYCADEQPTTEDEVVDMVFEHFKGILKRDLKKYETVIERNQKNGLKGGRPKTQINPVGYLETQENPSKPKKPDTDNDTDTDTDILLKKETKLNLSERELNFKNDCRVFLNEFGKELLISFFNYWSEPNHLKTKMRFELEKTFDIKRRLKTWQTNSTKFETKTNKPNTPMI
jgi:hypothetical protein